MRASLRRATRRAKRRFWRVVSAAAARRYRRASADTPTVQGPARLNGLDGLDDRSPSRVFITTVPVGRGASLRYRLEAAQLAEALRRLDVSVSIVDRPASSTFQTSARSLVVLLAPGIPRTLLPVEATTVAWVSNELEAWLRDSRFDDHDLVFASTEELASALRRQAAKPVHVIDVKHPTAEAAALLVAVSAWTHQPAVAIHIAPLSWFASATWGDTPFARSVQKAFERQGWRASVHVANESDAPRAAAADVALHIHGLREPAVRPGQTSALWVISHPELVSPAMCEQYDLVFVASQSFAARLSEQVKKPVHVLPQATDPDRFRPDPTGPAHDLLFVGGARGEERRQMLDALSHGPWDLAVYGGGWTPERLDARYVRGQWIANQDLHRYYASAAIVLNDHWPEMREQGFISNRTFDALASGGFVVSDAVPGMDELFDGAVETFDEAAELPTLVKHFLSHPDERRERVERGRAAVLSRHTFDDRVKTILGALREVETAPRKTLSARTPTASAAAATTPGQESS